jgi:hypothetical protein
MLKTIETKEQYDILLVRVYQLMQEDIIPKSAKFKELESLSILIEEFEIKHYAILPINR